MDPYTTHPRKFVHIGFVDKYGRAEHVECPSTKIKPNTNFSRWMVYPQVIDVVTITSVDSCWVATRILDSPEPRWRMVIVHHS